MEIKIPTRIKIEKKEKRNIPKKIIADYKGKNVFNNRQFYYKYREKYKDVLFPVYCSIISDFFKLSMDFILKGVSLHYPIGNISITKIYNNDKLRISFSACKKHEKETGEKKIIYRNNNYYYKIVWFVNKKIENLKRYKLMIPSYISMTIPNYKNYLENHV